MDINYDQMRSYCEMTIKHQSIRMLMLDCFNQLTTNSQKVFNYLKYPSFNNQENLLSLIQNVQSILLSTRRRIETEKANQEDIILAFAFLDEITRYYGNIHSQFIDAKQTDESLSLQVNDLLQGHQLVTSGNLAYSFNAIAASLKNTFKERGYFLKQPLFSYVNSLYEEGWLPTLIQQLQQSLHTAGIETCVDKIKYEKCPSLISYLEEKAEQYYVLLIGTPSLSAQYGEEDPKKFLELQRPFSILPILLCGKIKNAFPIYISRFVTIMDWRKADYFTNIQQLIHFIYQHAFVLTLKVI